LGRNLKPSRPMPATSKRLRIALATCQVLPEPDLDFQPLSRALTDRGCAVEAVPWDGPDVWSDFDICVLRSTWNYYLEPDRFLRWVDVTAERCQLLNPAVIVRWNVDKRYLRRLQNSGVPIVETIWLEPGQPADTIAEVSRARNWSRFVVKPVISAASFCTRSFSGNELPAAIDFLALQLHQRAMMVQPFIESVESVGEKSIAWIDGEITHAWVKRPRFAGQDESVRPTDEISTEDRAVVERAVRGCRDEILYARVDLMYDTNGQPSLSELELIEPSLYFDFSPNALDRFANGILRRVK
jgi:hypothetical protein